MGSLQAVRPRASAKVRSADTHKILAWVGAALARMGVVLISLVLCLPVLLSPITTAIPSWAWIAMAVADLP